MSQALARQVFMSGKSILSPFFLLKVSLAENKTAASRSAVSVSKKIAPTAVERNTARRRVYTVVRNLWPRISPGFSFGISVKKGGENMPLEKVQIEIATLLARAGLLK